MDGLSSCQCTMELHGDRKETKNCVLRIPNCSGLREKMRARTWVRFLGLDQIRNGPELIRTNRMENVFESPRT